MYIYIVIYNIYYINCKRSVHLWRGTGCYNNQFHIISVQDDYNLCNIYVINYNVVCTFQTLHDTIR